MPCWPKLDVRTLVTDAAVELGVPVQIAYAVDDVERAAQSFADRFGAGPFFIRHHPPFEATHDGAPAIFNHSSAYGQWGHMQIELVQLGDCSPVSLHQLVSAQPGIHHVADNGQKQAHHDDLPGIPTNNAKADDLTLLKGIGVVIQHQLNGMGVYTFKQIALWTGDQVEDISQRLAFRDRIFRENWIDQAREWHFKTHGEML